MRNIFVWAIGLLAFAAAGSAQVTEFPIPTANSKPSGITRGPDGNLWFTEFGANKIGRITPDGIITEFPIPTANSAPYGITAGPDGNVWFTEMKALNIGRITNSGVITEFPAPTDTNVFLNGITAAPDGNLWFAGGLFGFGKIGRITTSGAVTEFSDGFRPFGITAGPDGNLWFTDSSLAGDIGRITTSGAGLSFVNPDPGLVYPFAITSGPDGNLWLTYFDMTPIPRSKFGPRVGRITTGGVVTAFPVPAISGSLMGITAGPDGNLWFTEPGKIGRITTCGAVTEFPIPTVSGGPAAITVGPDGNLWFTEVDGNQIGRLTLAGYQETGKTPLIGVTALNLERAIPLANVLTTLPLNADPTKLAAIASGALEIRELLVYAPQSGIVTSTVFLVTPRSPLPSPIGVVTAANTVTRTTISISDLVTSCSPIPSLLFIGTITGSLGNLYGTNLVGAPAGISIGLTTDLPPKVHDVSETIAGVVTVFSSAASGTLTLSAAPSTGGGNGGTGPTIVVKFANGSIAVPNAVTQALFSPFLLDASGSSSTGGALTFAWSTTSNSPVAFVGTGVPGQILVQFPGPGAYAIQLKVSDASGASALFTITLEFTGRPQ
jgi:streptogramin lyase